MQQQTVLVVDHNEPHRRLLYDLLSAKCYRVLLAENGGCAIELARQERPALILLDIRLPDMSGLEVARILKATSETRAIPIAAITALAMPGEDAAGGRYNARGDAMTVSYRRAVPEGTHDSDSTF